MDLIFHTLPNGIRLVHYPTTSEVAHCGVIINAGSRDELPEEHGMAHFIEHMLFKGTAKRKSFHILSRLEDVGGELNAYTTKEETAIHASFLKEHYSRAVELLADLLFASTYNAAEIEKEHILTAPQNIFLMSMKSSSFLISLSAAAYWVSRRQ